MRREPHGIGLIGATLLGVLAHAAPARAWQGPDPDGGHAVLSGRVLDAGAAPVDSAEVLLLASGDLRLVDQGWLREEAATEEEDEEEEAAAAAAAALLEPAATALLEPAATASLAAAGDSACSDDKNLR